MTNFEICDVLGSRTDKGKAIQKSVEQTVTVPYPLTDPSDPAGPQLRETTDSYYIHRQGQYSIDLV